MGQLFGIGNVSSMHHLERVLILVDTYVIRDLKGHHFVQDCVVIDSVFLVVGMRFCFVSQLFSSFIQVANNTLGIRKEP